VLEKGSSFDEAALSNFKNQSRRRATVHNTVGLEDYVLEKPEPPTPGQISHRTIELKNENWSNGYS